MWSKGIVGLVENALDMKIQGNNQGYKGYIGNEKSNKDIQKHTGELATYALFRWKDSLKTERMLMQQIKQLNYRITQTKARRWKAEAK